MEKAAAFEAGVEMAMEKLALSTDLVSRALGKRIGQAMGKGKRKLLSNAPLANIVMARSAAKKIMNSPLGQRYARGLKRGLRKDFTTGSKSPLGIAMSSFKNYGLGVGKNRIG